LKIILYSILTITVIIGFLNLSSMKTLKKMTIGIISLSILWNGECSGKGDDFVPLFDGKTFKGWVIPENSVPSWKVVDGAMVNDGIGPNSGSLIWTEREDYKDFILKVEWKLAGEPEETMAPLYDYNGDLIIDENGNQVRKKGVFAGDGGVFVRGIRFKKDVPESTRNRFTDAHFNIWTNPMGSGENHGYMVNKKMPPEVRRGAIPLKNADKPLGEWNTFIITLIGEHVTVELNGEMIIQMDMPELPETGAIGLQQHAPGKNAVRPYPILYRNILIKEL